MFTLVFLAPNSYRNEVEEAQVKVASNRLIKPCSKPSAGRWEVQQLINGTWNGLGELLYEFSFWRKAS